MLKSRLLLITSDYSPRVGGVARYYAGLKQALGTLTVLTSARGGSQPGVVRFNWFWPGWPHWLPLLWMVPWYRLRLRATHLGAGEILPVGIALWLMHWAFGWPYFVFLHGLDIQLTQQSRWKRWLARQILKQAHTVVVNSRYTLQLAQRAGAAVEHSVVVYPCATLPQAEPSVKQALRARYRLGAGPVLLSVGRLVPRKGIATVLAALPEVQAVASSVTYVVVGQGPYRQDYERQAQSIPARVIFTGEVTDEELAAWYAVADIFVLVPEFDHVDVEGFGTVFLEAQAAGKVVVGSRTGGVPEAVGEAGRLVSTTAELVATLRELLARPQERVRLGQLGLARVAREFTWVKQAAKVQQRLYGASEH